MPVKTKFFSANLTYFILIVGFVVIRLSSSLNWLGFLGENQKYVYNLILQIGLMLILPIFLYSKLIKQKPKTTIKNFGLRKIKLSAILLAVFIGVIVFVLNIGVSSFFSFLLSLFGYEKLPTATEETYTLTLFILNLIFTAFLPAICEEVTHRGMLIDGFSGLGYKKVIIISAFLFGLTHLNVDQFFYATIIGFLLAFITMATGNLIPAIIIHFMNNVINVVIGYLVAINPAFKQLYNSIFESMTTNSPLLVMSTLFFVISLLLFLLGLLIYKLFKETTIADISSLAELETKKQLRAELMDEPPVPKPADGIPFSILRDNKIIQFYVTSQIITHPYEQKYFPALNEKSFLIASFVLAIFVTVATFIWGLL